MTSDGEIVAYLEAACSVKIENRGNWFASKRVRSVSRYVDDYVAVITDIISTARSGKLADAVVAMIMRFTCQLCSTDVTTLTRQQIDQYGGQYLMGEQLICQACLGRMKNRPINSIVGP